MNDPAPRPARRRPPSRCHALSSMILLLVGVLASNLAMAQPSLLREFAGAAGDEKLGRSVAGAGDINDDGHDDVIVGIPGALSSTGRVVVYSGIDGDVLHAFDGAPGGLFFGSTVANAGDVDNDGF